MAVGLSGLVIAEAAGHAAGFRLMDSVPVGDAQISSAPLLIAATAIGALAPDIDHPHALLANFKFGGAWIGGALGLLLGAVLSGQPELAAQRDLLPFVGLLLGMLFGMTFLKRVRLKALKGVAVIAGEVAGHRKFFHSILATSIVAVLATAFLVPAGLPFVAAALTWGYLSHLIADSMTRSGVPWLWPKSTPYGLPRSLRFTTGTIAEYFVVSVCIGAAITAVALFGIGL